MKQLIVLIFAIVTGCNAVDAQTTSALEKNAGFTGAVADKKEYCAIYQFDSNDPKVISKGIRNLNNALNDERLKGKIHIELVAFAGGTDMMLKGSNYENDLKALVEKGVIVAQCANSLREKNLTRDSLYNFVAVVPSGNGELIIRQAQGWAVVKP